MAAKAAMHPRPAAFEGLEERFERLPMAQLVPSKTNPRTHFDQTYLTDLARSLAEKGVIEPIVVRELDMPSGMVEIVAGECRYRAAKIAGLTHLPAIIRAYTDDQVLEIQLIENLHRKDLTALEQAKGYRALIDSNPTKHSAESIAARLGMSPAWVWDRMKLNDLIPEAKLLLEQERMSVGHAILIARLKYEDQMRTIAFDDESSSQHRGHGLWRHDAGFDFDEDDPANKGKKPGKYDGLKPCSVRELESWIKDHIRFDVEHAAKAAPLQFETAAAQVEQAAAQPGRGKKVVHITFDSYVQPEAKGESERTYGPRSWRLADGTKKSQLTDSYPRRLIDAPECDHSVLGVVAVGTEHYGETFQVCIARDKCAAHWGKEIKAREKTQKLRESGQTSKANKSAAAAEARERRDRQALERRAQRWKHFAPALKKAVAAAVAKVSATVPKPIFRKVLAAHGLPTSTTPSQLPKALLEDAIRRTFGNSWSHDEPRMVAWAKLLGVDVKACEPQPLHTSGEKAKKAAKGKAA